MKFKFNDRVCVTQNGFYEGAIGYVVRRDRYDSEHGVTYLVNLVGNYSSETEGVIWFKFTELEKVEGKVK